DHLGLSVAGDGPVDDVAKTPDFDQRRQPGPPFDPRWQAAAAPPTEDLDVLPAVKLRGFLVPAGCLDRRSCGYRRGLVGSGGSRRAALSHRGFGFAPGVDARHRPPRGRMPAASPLR